MKKIFVLTLLSNIACLASNLPQSHDTMATQLSSIYQSTKKLEIEASHKHDMLLRKKTEGQSNAQLESAIKTTHALTNAISLRLASIKNIMKEHNIPIS